MRFSMILEMVDRLSGPAKRARAGVGGLRETARALGQQMRRTAGDLQRGDRSLSDVARSGRRFAALGLRRVFERAGAGARSLGRDLLSLERRLKLAERAGYATGRGLKKLGVGAFDLLKGGVLGAGAAVAGAGSFALFDLFRTAGQFEQYQMMLDNSMGSAKAGKEAMSWISDFATRTPFELDEVVQSFQKLKDAGLDPMKGSLLAVGDAAAGMNEPLLRAAEAMADAARGQFERLVDLGISASTQGNKVRLTWMKNEKQYEKVVDKADKLGIALAVAAAWNHKFAGSQERQSTSLFGIISNLKDQWSRFLVMIAKAGIFDVVKRDLQSLLDKINEMAASGELRKWAEEISQGLQDAWKWGKAFVENTDWDQVGRDLRAIADAVTLIARGLAELQRYKNVIDFVSGFGINPLQNPVLREGLRRATGTSQPAAPPAVRQGPARLPSDSSLFRGLPRQSSANLSGALKIEVSGAPGLSVRATPVTGNGSNLAMEVRTGRTMRSAA